MSIISFSIAVCCALKIVENLAGCKKSILQRSKCTFCLALSCVYLLIGQKEDDPPPIRTHLNTTTVPFQFSYCLLIIVLLYIFLCISDN